VIAFAFAEAVSASRESLRPTAEEYRKNRPPKLVRPIHSVAKLSAPLPTAERDEDRAQSLASAL
jgi:hypothetical protein